MRTVCVIAALAALVGGCAAAQPRMMWARTDGKPTSADIDTAIVQCRGEAAQAAAGNPGPAFPST